MRIDWLSPGPAGSHAGLNVNWHGELPWPTGFFSEITGCGAFESTVAEYVSAAAAVTNAAPKTTRAISLQPCLKARSG